jgi:hypothetical protein
MTVIRRVLAACRKRRLLAVATAATAVVVATASTGDESAGVPASAAHTVHTPPYSASAPCRQDTFQHVHHPVRLVLVAPCATVVGSVTTVRRQPTDGDWRVMVRLDPQYSRYVSDVRKPLEVRVIPTDIATVVLPKPGDRIAASGAWVRNRNMSGRLQLHPTWSIQRLTPPGGTGDGPVPPPSEPNVDVHLDVPTQVRVGETFAISATVTGHPPRPVPVPAAHLWLEVVPEQGPAVQWRAGATNSRGVAILPIVALYRPGRYHLHLYVERQGRVKSMAEQLEVVR